MPEATGASASSSARASTPPTRAPLFAPHLGARWPLGRITLRANLGRLFRDPSIDELFLQSAGIRGNPNLRQEDGWGADAGVHGRWGPLRVGVTGFAQRYDRLILFVPISAWLIEAQDRFAAEALGIEAELAVRWRWLRARLTHLEQRVEFRDGPRLPFRPDRITGLHVSLALPRGVGVFSDLRRPSAVSTDVFGQRRLPGYLWIDAGATWQTGAWRVALQMRNLTAARALDALQQPQPERAWLLGLRWRP